jgi:hypothetical protein
MRSARQDHPEAAHRLCQPPAVQPEWKLYGAVAGGPDFQAYRAVDEEATVAVLELCQSGCCTRAPPCTNPPPPLPPRLSRESPQLVQKVWRQVSNVPHLSMIVKMVDRIGPLPSTLIFVQNANCLQRFREQVVFDKFLVLILLHLITWLLGNHKGASSPLLNAVTHTICCMSLLGGFTTELAAVFYCMNGLASGCSQYDYAGLNEI